MILRADLLIRRGFGCFIRLQPLGDHWLCSPDLHAAALIRPRDGRPRLTGASVPTQGQGPQQMEHIWGMHQPHQRTAFDQTGALLGLMTAADGLCKVSVNATPLVGDDGVCRGALATFDDLTPIDPESYASRRHGKITQQGDQFIMEDLGSANGTFLNGTRVEKGVQHPLREGDKVRFGKTEFLFTYN